MIKLNDKFVASYVTGGGTIHEEGKFTLTHITKKFMTLTMTRAGFYCQDDSWIKRKIPLMDFKYRKEPMPKWISEDEFVCYHQQSGTPTVYRKQTETEENTDVSTSKNKNKVF